MAPGGMPNDEEMQDEVIWAPPAAAPGTPQREAVGVGQYQQEGQVPNDSPMLVTLVFGHRQTNRLSLAVLLTQAPP